MSFSGKWFGLWPGDWFGASGDAAPSASVIARALVGADAEIITSGGAIQAAANCIASVEAVALATQVHSAYSDIAATALMGVELEGDAPAEQNQPLAQPGAAAPRPYERLAHRARGPLAEIYGWDDNPIVIPEEQDTSARRENPVTDGTDGAAVGNPSRMAPLPEVAEAAAMAAAAIAKAQLWRDEEEMLFAMLSEL